MNWAMNEKNYSQRRACSTLKVDRALYVYKSRRGEQADLKARIKEIAETRMRYWLSAHSCAAAAGGVAGESEANLSSLQGDRPAIAQQDNETAVKAKLRENRSAAVRHNETWAMDFVHDQLATGRKIRMLTLVDTFSRYSPAVDARFSCRGEDVV